MNTVFRVLLIAGGIFLVIFSLASAVRSTILPRSTRTVLNTISVAAVRGLTRLISGRAASFERRDRVLAASGPLILLTTLASWLATLLAGFTLIYMGILRYSVTKGIEVSGSSAFTLGSTEPKDLPTSVVSYLEAGLGLLILTLLITYLPTIYQAFSRRETGVRLFRVRAGTPPKATTTIIRYFRVDPSNAKLQEAWQLWESWFVDIEESHTTFSILAFFRSSQPDQHWLNSAGAVLDAASLWLAAVEHPTDPDAQLCVRAGFLALRQVGEVFGIRFDTDPKPTDPISISRSEFDEALDELADAGLPVLADRDQAWRDWAGWRVNYDVPLLSLAREVDAPPAPWVSDRSPIGLGPRRWHRRFRS